MSRLSLSAYVPWSRVKVTGQNVNADPPSALVRLEPDQRYRPRCHVYQQPDRSIHSPARKFVRDLDFGGYTTMLRVEYRKVWCDRATACGWNISNSSTLTSGSPIDWLVTTQSCVGGVSA